MPEVQRPRLGDDAAGPHARGVEAAREIVVLVAPADVAFVEAVHAPDVVTEKRKVAAEKLGLVRTGEMPAAQPGLAFVEDLGGLRLHEIRPLPGAIPVRRRRRGGGLHQFARGLFGENAPMAGEQPARRSAPFVNGQGVGEQRDVAVREDEVVAGGGADGAIARGGEAVAVVRLPDALRGDGAAREMALDRGGGVRIGAVVGHDDLVRPTGLDLERREKKAEVLRAVVDGGDDANLHGAGRSRPRAARAGEIGNGGSGGRDSPRRRRGG